MPQGTLTSFDLTAGLPRDFDPLITLLDPSDVVLQGMYGADGRTVLASRPATQKKIEWQDEQILTPRSTLGVAMLAGDATMTVTPTTDRLKFQTSDIVKVENENMLVTGYNATDGVLNVTRGYQGTTAAGHAVSLPIKGLGSALPEGSDPQEIRALDRTDRYNLTQIFGPVEVKVSGTRQATTRYGVANEVNHQAANRMREMYIAREQAFIYGIRWEDTTTERRTTGGLEYFITTNVDTTTTTLTFSAIRTQMQNIYNSGGMADRLLVPVARKAAIDDFDDTDVRLTRGDNGRGQTVETLHTSFGDVLIVMSREVDSTDLFLFRRDNVRLRPLRPMQFVPLAKTGDATRGMLVSEIGLEVRADAHAARFSALTA